MKYLTKEWYQKMQSSDLHVGLSAHDGCISFDESSYLKIYKEKETEYIETQREIHQVDIKEINFGLNPKEQQSFNKIKKYWNKKKSFDERRAKEDFKIFTNPQTDFIKSRLKMIPPHIKGKIADERVFILGYTTKDIIDELEIISTRNQKEVEKTLDLYNKNQDNDDEKINQLSFHDFQVRKITKNKKGLKINFLSGYPFKSIEFIEVELIEFNHTKKQAFWLYEEVYKINEGYEIHVMFDDLSYLTLKCRDFIIKQKFNT